MDTYKHLRVNAEDLAEALDSRLEEGVWLLEVNTGEIHIALGDEIDGEPTEESWEDSDRYLVIDPIPSHESFRFMEDFLEDLPEGEALRALDRALRLPRPFRAFKPTLEDFPALRETWFKFQHAKMLEYAQGWLEDNVPGAKLAFPTRS